MGEVARGRALLERALAIRSAQLPANDLKTAFTHSQLGYLCSQSGDHASALAHFRKGVEIAESASGKDSVLVASYYSALGFGLGAIGDPSATEYLERSVELYQDSPQKNSPGAADAYRRLGEDLLYRGKTTQAPPASATCIKQASNNRTGNCMPRSRSRPSPGSTWKKVSMLLHSITVKKR